MCADMFKGLLLKTSLSKGPRNKTEETWKKRKEHSPQDYGNEVAVPRGSCFY